MQKIESIEQLHEVGNPLQAIFSAYRYPDYQLAISNLPESANQEIGQRINRYKNECGCTSGSLMTGLTILIILCSYITGFLSVSSLDFQQFLLLMGIVVGAASVGKILTILYARIRMVLLIRRVIAIIDDQKNVAHLKA